MILLLQLHRAVSLILDNERLTASSDSQNQQGHGTKRDKDPLAEQTLTTNVSGDRSVIDIPSMADEKKDVINLGQLNMMKA